MHRLDREGRPRQAAAFRGTRTVALHGTNRRTVSVQTTPRNLLQRCCNTVRPAGARLPTADCAD